MRYLMSLVFNSRRYDIMKNRSLDYYRHHRKRIIARKVYIFTHIWGNELFEYENRDYKPFPIGKYSKGKVHCSCKVCKYDKHFEIKKHKVKSKEQAMKQEIDDYFNNKE
ncbi:gp99 [Bacillus phage G]|uniref:Gp99 n=1 Tax=Bacillus phage G TaxID=2884420 RepID=G3MBG1_9CAUD|nr:gp99 [Bacillus phage G]AEO93361.1 gp99 [Bacillus phage G]